MPASIFTPVGIALSLKSKRGLCNASPALVPGQLLDDPPEAALRGVRARVQGPSAFVVYLGLDATMSELGLEGEYATGKFASDEARVYDPAAAEAFFQALTSVAYLMTVHRNTLTGEVGPIQFWPHGFDLAFEWFGTRVEEYEEDGELTEYPSQLNVGFYTTGRAYLYSNPWPFEADQLLDAPLPSGAAWNTEGWQGSKLSYDQVAGKQDAAEEVLAYVRAVYDLAAPTLTT